MARDTLEHQLPAGVFRERVAGLAPACYDPQDNAFTFAVEDPFARDWLEARLARQLAQALLGACARPAAVRFVLAGE
jgi:hypothetical protein